MLVIFITLTILLCGYWINAFYGPFFIPVILEAYNRYQLGSFLIVCFCLHTQK